jgi:hypothetical protein
MKELRIYCEGGGDGPVTKDPFRRGMGAFLKPLIESVREQRIRFELIVCGGRQTAYDDFKTALRLYPDAFNVLLVDAEAHITEAHAPWQHLKARDGWDALSCSNEQCFLMVQAMEAWLMADLDALKKFYGQGFNANVLPKNPQVELIAKDQLEPALIKASGKTQKGEYKKIGHGAKLLALIDRDKVRKASPHCDRLFTTLENKLKEPS